MEKLRVTEGEFQRAFDVLTNKALQEPVTITKAGRDHLVVVSADEFARLKRRDRLVGLTSELPEEWAFLQQPRGPLTVGRLHSHHPRPRPDRSTPGLERSADP